MTTTTSSRRGVMFVISSPSGAGKTTLSRRLLANEKPEDMVMSVSVTTRAKRPGEVEGKDYFFIAPEVFKRMADGGELLEHAQVFDNFYGTPAAKVEGALSQGIDVLFDVDWQGNQKLASVARNDLVSIFILPPSLSELERRLTTRAQDSAEVVARRMKKAAEEISHWQEYDYVVVNEDIDTSLAQITTILHAERLKRTRQPALIPFVESLS